MTIKIVDVSESLGEPPLAPRSNLLQPKDPGDVVVATLLLNTILINGGNWPANLGQITVSGYLWHHTKETLWLVTLVYLNDSVAEPIYGFGPTYSVEFGEPYHPKLDAELTELLRQDLW